MGSNWRRGAAVLLIGAAIGGQLVIGAVPARAVGTTYHVTVTGNDAADGLTISQAFRTIGRCAAVALPGDTCSVHEGTYRETVTPARSGTSGAPIRFEAAAGEAVTVDGADQVDGWSPVRPDEVPPTLAGSGFASAVAGGRVYQSTININPELFANQLFLDGSMSTEARWPNSASANPLTTTVAHAGPLTTPDAIHDPAIVHPAGFWTGGTAWVLGGGAMVLAHTGTILTSAPGVVTFDSPWLRRGPAGCIYTCARPANTYYLTGVLGALDAAGEWFYDPSASRLYLWPATNDDPTDHVVEVKQRDYAFDLSGRSHIVVHGFNVFAATVLTNDASTNNIIDGINAYYVSHFVGIPFPPRVETSNQTNFVWLGSVFWETAPLGQMQDLSSYQDNTGIILHGTGNVLRNSSVTFSAGNGVSVFGERNTVENNVISEVVYGGAANSGIVVGGKSRFSTVGAKDHIITRNTVFDVGGGYGGIGVNNMANKLQTTFSNIEISYNDIFNTGVRSQDGGPIYVCCSGGTKFNAGVNAHHNWAHDHLAKTDRWNTLAHTGGGLYSDISASGVTFHHNVSWNHAGEAMRLNGAGPHDSAQNHLIYNNTLGPGNERSLGSGAPNMNGTRIINNIFRSPIVQVKPGAVAANNLPSTLDPRFVDANGGDFQLQSGSPAIDYGQAISGITDGYVGAAPDAGAYELGAPSWTPGCLLSLCSVLRVDDHTLGSGGFSYSANWSGCQGCDGTGGPTYSYNDTLMTSAIAGTTATFSFSGTAVQLHARTGPGQGIAAVSIDGGPEQLVDLWAPQPGTGPIVTAPKPTGTGDQLVWRSPLLDGGSHMVQVRVTGTRNPLAAGSDVAIDRADVFNMPAPIHWRRAVPLTVAVDATASPATAPEPDATVEFPIVVTNTSAEEVTLTSLTDSAFGDLDGRGTCAVGVVLQAVGQYACAFSGVASGSPGRDHFNTVTAVVSDDEGRTATGADVATVTFTDVMPQIQVERTAEPTTMPAPGGVATFTVRVENHSVEPVTLTSMTDSAYGDLTGDDDCHVGSILDAGASCTFAYSGSVGPAPGQYTATATVRAVDDEQNETIHGDDASVTVTPACATRPSGCRNRVK